jgi:hypothetical protein
MEGWPWQTLSIIDICAAAMLYCALIIEYLLIQRGGGIGPMKPRQPPIRFWNDDFGFWIMLIHKSKIQNPKSKIGKVLTPTAQAGR